MDGVITETGRSVQQTVEEDLRQELEPVQTLLQQTEEQSVQETTPSQELATHNHVLVRPSSIMIAMSSAER